MKLSRDNSGGGQHARATVARACCPERLLPCQVNRNGRLARSGRPKTNERHLPPTAIAKTKSTIVKSSCFYSRDCPQNKGPSLRMRVLHSRFANVIRRHLHRASMDPRWLAPVRVSAGGDAATPARPRRPAAWRTVRERLPTENRKSRLTPRCLSGLMWWRI